ARTHRPRGAARGRAGGRHGRGQRHPAARRDAPGRALRDRGAVRPRRPRARPGPPRAQHDPARARSRLVLGRDRRGPGRCPRAGAAADAGRAALLVHAVAEDPGLLHAGTEDWLHQRYREPAMPEAYALMARLRTAGFAAAISGAGPSVVVLGTEASLAGLEA